MNEIADTEASNAIFYAELDTKLATMTPYARQNRLRGPHHRDSCVSSRNSLGIIPGDMPVALP
jgi:hypothetical protein